MIRPPMREWGNTPLVVASGFRCGYCDCDLLQSLERFASLAFDHYKPRSRGGSNDPSNIVISCHLCDRWKRSFCPSSVDDVRLLVNDVRSRIEAHYLRYRTAYRPFMQMEGGRV